MNPSPPFPYPSFTFLPTNPNPIPNPNPNFIHSLPQTPQILPQNLPSITPNLDLPTTHSLLKHLIHLSETTLHSISNLLHATNSSNPNHGLCPCPFNPHHRVPPESLFRHSLQCPSSPAILDLCLLESLNYPKTLKSESELSNQNRFLQTLHDPNTELCFSLDDYGDFASNFFYRDCPGVVTSFDQDSTKPTFTLPGILSVECVNFIGDGGDREIRGFSRDCVRLLLPSELWAVRSEIEAWNDYPTLYSYSVLRAILCSWVIKESDLMRWVISNSPRYGVVIDVHMRDHLFVLFRLCLKAISREAFRSADSLLNGEVKERDLAVIPKTTSFECPILVKVLMWLASQLSVLYGEANGKFFSINMLKQCLLNAALGSLLFPMERKVTESPGLKELSRDLDADISDESVRAKLPADVKLEEPVEKSREYEIYSIVSETINSRVIFVSQVAAAVAALHERFLLEEKIKGLRVSRSLTRYQRMAEHAYVSMRADEERQKRPNYRPILEHDGLLWQRSRNQETSKTKTREELLAEERDYKRRRMSYRGKKLKRNTTQVMRDIIEGYMEEIKQAGGIGCFVKGAEEGGMFPSESLSAHDITTDIDELRKNVYDSSEGSRGKPHGYRKHLRSDYDIGSSRFEVPSPKDYEQERRGSHGHHEYFEDRRRSIGMEKRDREHDREHYSRSHGRSHEWSSHRRERDDVEVTRSKHQEINQLSSNMSKYRDNRSFSSASRSESDSTVGKDDQKLEVKDRRQRNAYGNHRSGFTLQNAFEDRYDPSESRDMYEDDVSSNSKYVRPDKLYSQNDGEHFHKRHSGYPPKGDYPDYHKKS